VILRFLTLLAAVAKGLRSTTVETSG